MIEPSSKLATAITIAAAIAFGICVHEYTHSLQSVALGNGWHDPVFFPFTLAVCPVGPNGFLAIGCTEVGDGFQEHWWSGETLPYVVQLLATVAFGLAIAYTRRALVTRRATAGVA